MEQGQAPETTARPGHRTLARLLPWRKNTGQQPGAASALRCASRATGRLKNHGAAKCLGVHRPHLLRQRQAGNRMRQSRELGRPSCVYSWKLKPKNAKEYGGATETVSNGLLRGFVVRQAKRRAGGGGPRAAQPVRCQPPVMAADDHISVEIGSDAGLPLFHLLGVFS
jgi:hypothetical protein